MHDPLFDHGGEMGTAMARFDWAATPLGPSAEWPANLRTVTSLCLASRFPTLVMWGRELLMLYNDGFRPILGNKHPASLAQPGAICWREIWDYVGPLLHGVLDTGEPVWAEDLPLVLERGVRCEECYFTFSYSPIRGGASPSADGVFVTVAETTSQVLNTRRMACLRELNAAQTGAGNPAERLGAALGAVGRYSSELPFLCIYPPEGEEVNWEPVVRGLNRLVPAEAWPLSGVVAGDAPAVVAIPAGVVGVAGEAGARIPQEAVLVPVHGGSEQLLAVLVCGVNPLRRLDEQYLDFLTLVAEDIAAGLSASEARDDERRQAREQSVLDEARASGAMRRADRLDELVQAGLRIASRVDPEAVLESVASEARTLFGATGVEIVTDAGERRIAGSLAHHRAEHELGVEFGESGRLRLLLRRSAPLEQEERALCEQLSIVGLAALERARLHAREHQAVLRLQEALLPRELPTQPNLQLAVRYLPANVSAAIGGDWYDVFTLENGQIAAIVGDVVGHGMDAAAAMSSLRNILRAFLSEGGSAAEALSRLHEVSTRTEIGLTATVCCVTLDPETGAGEWASAGHPAPLLVPAEGQPRYLASDRDQQPALGVGHRPIPVRAEIVLRPGDTLLLYTDGLVERRSGEAEQSDQLVSAASRRCHDLDTYCDKLIDDLAPTTARRDDVALLALHHNGPGERVLEMRVFGRPSAPSQVRRRLRTWLRDVPLSTEVADDVIVAVSEALANAIEHSGISPYEEVTFRASQIDRTLRMTVRDPGRWRVPREESYRGHGLALMKALMDDVEIDRRDDGTRIDMTRRIGEDQRGHDD